MAEGGYTLVVGLARSGVGAANLLVKEGREVVATDRKREEDLSDSLRELDPGVRLELGGHPRGLAEGASLVVVSPGVPSDIALIKKAREAGAEVIGELELGWRAYEGVPFYAVTGTNGKSTTVSLLAMMMERSGRRCLLGGNIGRPLTAEAAAGVGADCVVAEVSSFQLETVVRFHARGAAILNVTPDHMDRYDSMESYMKAKADIGINQGPGDFLVLNADDPGCAELNERFISRVAGREGLFFSRKHEVRGVYIKDDGIFVNLGASSDGALIPCADIGIKGVHNLENAMAASLLALCAGCPAEAVASALRDFCGLEHRLEFVREVRGATYVNDSKGTNVAAAVKSLEGFSGPVVLIAGGRDKGGDFRPLARLLEDKARAVVLIGEASEKMEGEFTGSANCVRASDMEDAVRQALEMAEEGDTVLLSPACASFDMFRDFEERGRVFKEAVNRL
jgi:UDP-N-acetylmuramoylalanine--D-glutamate ligase